MPKDKLCFSCYYVPKSIKDKLKENKQKKGLSIGYQVNEALKEYLNKK